MYAKEHGNDHNFIVDTFSQNLNSADFDNLKIDKIVNYIYNNIDKPLTSKQLAKKFNMSEKTLYTKFKKYKFTTPHRFIWFEKMKYATNLLNEKEYSIKEISTMVGYDNPKTFSTVFKRYYGSAPSKFNQ